MAGKEERTAAPGQSPGHGVYFPEIPFEQRARRVQGDSGKLPHDSEPACHDDAAAREESCGRRQGLALMLLVLGGYEKMVAQIFMEESSLLSTLFSR